jgi:hypothetical protein
MLPQCHQVKQKKQCSAACYQWTSTSPYLPHAARLHPLQAPQAGMYVFLLFQWHIAPRMRRPCHCQRLADSSIIILQSNFAHSPRSPNSERAAGLPPPIDSRHHHFQTWHAHYHTSLPHIPMPTLNSTHSVYARQRDYETVVPHIGRTSGRDPSFPVASPISSPLDQVRLD